ncbi:MAG: HEAT repeat domain-containing protein [Methanospirillum sp.]|uniref:HEAT repeat domain-containing protein n=1 Tax=Methanospirillum sp. TaxID=45200 RepID=UPI002369ACC5|nr:HEAT repeat domain-containing protein [Methanospirillum sp.]MDD1728823.1 HEAT repeat domain-containing protein [Methanospirillum sp.]
MLDRILVFISNHRGTIETGKVLLIALLALVSLFASIYVLWASPWTGFRFIYVFIPHLYLIPIILLALWYPKSGIRLIGIILVSIISFWIFAEIFGYQFSISFVMLYTGLDLATIMVLLLYVKDRRLVEAVLTDLIERSEKTASSDRFYGEFEAIISALKSPDEHDREEAVDALSGLSDERAILPLIRSLQDESPYVRRAAAEALGKSSSHKPVKSLIQVLTDQDRYVREAAAEALGHLGNYAIPDLLKNLGNEDWRIRIGSVIALRVSSGSLPSLDPVILVLSDPSPYVRREAVKTLGRIGDQSVVPYLVQATKDNDPGVRLRAVRAVAKLGKPEEVVIILKRCLQDSDSAVRVRATEELKNIDEGKI